MSYIDLCLCVCVDAEYGYEESNELIAMSNPSSSSPSMQLKQALQEVITSQLSGNASLLLDKATWMKYSSLLLDDDKRKLFANIFVIENSSVDTLHLENSGNIVQFKDIASSMRYLLSSLTDKSSSKSYLHRLFVIGSSEQLISNCLQETALDQVVIIKLNQSMKADKFLTWFPKELDKKMRSSKVDYFEHYSIETFQKIQDFEFSCESVTEGHPDKVCDIISDSIVDAYIAQDPWSKVACEVMAYENMVWLCGYSLSNAIVNEEEIVRNVLEELGLDDESKGLDFKTASVSVNIHKSPSPSIRDLKLIPADDQAVMYGYANNETKDMMPLPHYFATKLTLHLSYLRRCAFNNKTDGLSPSEIKLAYMLRPAGKACVTAKYEIINKIKRNASITVIVLEAQHNPGVDLDELKVLLRENVIMKILPHELLSPQVELFVNGDGEYTHGGFRGGGLTGRKQNIDTYGGWCRMGGGAFSGKDYRKMDRSGAYAARWIAKSLVEANLCDRCTVGLAYAIGHPQPLMITVDSEHTASLRGFTDNQLAIIVRKNFDLSAGGVIEALKLQTPIYKKTAAGGHFGREGFSWEIPKKLEYM